MKRQRVDVPTVGGSNVVFVAPRARRPIDKKLIGIAKTTIDATQVTTTLLTVTFPCTIVGLRWSLGAICDAGTTPTSFGWAVVVVRDGNTIGNLQIADGTDFYTPEQDVMAFGAATLAQIDTGSSNMFEGNTKTMRKLMGGDTLVWVGQAIATHTVRCAGCIQFFCKT